MEKNKWIRLAFWVLAYCIGPVLVLGIISGQPGPERLGSMIFIGILCIAWVILGNYGAMVAREMDP
ncbi:MAG: hypothetical protein NWE89_16310 [Candidatus Bathyarchaeota archaeon]|nr:hypothetical protein [Candidatus Bathyarchaeota archaeon]